MPRSGLFNEIVGRYAHRQRRQPIQGLRPLHPDGVAQLVRRGVTAPRGQVQVVFQENRQHLMPEVEAVAQRREPAQHPAHRAGRGQAQSEADEHRRRSQRQRHAVDQLVPLELRRIRLCAQLRIEPDQRQHAEHRTARAG